MLLYLSSKLVHAFTFAACFYFASSVIVTECFLLLTVGYLQSYNQYSKRLRRFRAKQTLLRNVSSFAELMFQVLMILLPYSMSGTSYLIICGLSLLCWNNFWPITVSLIEDYFLFLNWAFKGLAFYSLVSLRIQIPP